MSHVIPDLAQKAIRGQDPLRILGSGRQVRHYTYAGDLGLGIRACIENPAAMNQDFNLATPVGHTVLEVAENIWRRVHPGEPLRYVSDPPYEHDVQLRVPSVDKAKALLGFEARTSLDQILDEVMPWISEQVRLGTL